MDKYSEIRPYNDDEVREVIDRLLANREFLGAVARLRFPRLALHFSWLLKPLVGKVLARQLADTDDIRSMQLVVEPYMNTMIAKTTGGFSVSGLDNLPCDQPYLFMSNHRDIALDPALVNYSLHLDRHETLRIAIGDNLLTKDYASDLMRLNQSFIVQRSAKGPRQMLTAYRLLSSYVHKSITEDRVSVWIAQREGRAKDGYDQSEPAIIKMLAISQNKTEESFGDFIRSLHIVPVSISYQYDPLDESKARELAVIDSSGSYAKGEQEDIQNMARGIAGQKGSVHVAYGTPLTKNCDSIEQVVAQIERQIICNYVLHPSNFFAYRELYGECPQAPFGENQEPFDVSAHSRDEAEFTARLGTMPVQLRPYVLKMYANCISRKIELACLSGN